MLSDDRSCADTLPPSPKDGVGHAGFDIGIWIPRNDLPAVRIVVAPTDVTHDGGQKLYGTFQEANAALCGKTGWHSQDGETLGQGYELDLMLALLAGTYKGGWVIPPIAVMKAILDHLQNQHDRALFSSFGASTSGGRAIKTYGSSTPLTSCGTKPTWDGKPSLHCANVVRSLSLASGVTGWTHALQPRALWRPVRFTPAP